MDRYRSVFLEANMGNFAPKSTTRKPNKPNQPNAWRYSGVGNQTQAKPAVLFGSGGDRNEGWSVKKNATEKRSEASTKIMGCATGLVKYLVFLANLIFALAGLALVIIGIMYKLNYNDATRVLPNDFGLAPILSIIIGAIVFVTAFLGCCGAVKESPCMLTTYATILLIIFILQVAIGVYAFLQIKNTDQLHTTLRQKLQETFDKYTQENHNNEEAKETVELTQRFLKCCGVDGPDYYPANFPNFPASCCKPDVEHCSRDGPYVHHHGCVQKLTTFLEDSSQVVGGVAIGIAAVEILGAFFGLCLASSIRNQYRRNIYA